MLKELECPYCEHYNEEPDECYEQDNTYFCTCENCDKVFGFNFQYYKSYDTFITPCQNEDETGKAIEHKWNKIIGFPKDCFIGKYRCEYCDEERKFSEEQIKQLNLEI